MRKLINISAQVLLVTALAGCGGMTTRDRNTVIGAGVGGIAGSRSRAAAHWVLSAGLPWVA